MAELTKGQDFAVKKLNMWYKLSTSDQVFRIFGYAGAGKSFVVSVMMTQLGLSQENVKYATYTGKAALVLRKKSIPATTIHKLIYDAVEQEVDKVLPDGTVKKILVTKFVKKPFIPGDIQLIVLDECSMIDNKMWEDLLSFNIRIIVLGDPGQLPPIHGKSPIIDVKPDAFLDEIVRQSAGNPIIHLSMLAREGKPIRAGSYSNSVHVINKQFITDQTLGTADTIITTTNNLRDDLNNYMRHNIKGFDNPLPMTGDKLICRRNNWDKTLNGIPLVNGIIGDVISPIRIENDKVFKMDFKPEGFTKSYFEDLEVNALLFDPNLSAKDRKEIMGNKYNGSANSFEYGYAITAHLSQGSQWGNVCAYYAPFGDSEFRRKLLYTIITRAEHTLTLAM